MERKFTDAGLPVITIETANRLGIHLGKPFLHTDPLGDCPEGVDDPFGFVDQIGQENAALAVYMVQRAGAVKLDPMGALYGAKKMYELLDAQAAQTMPLDKKQDPRYTANGLPIITKNISPEVLVDVERRYLEQVKGSGEPLDVLVAKIGEQDRIIGRFIFKSGGFSNDRHGVIATLVGTYRMLEAQGILYQGEHTQH